MDTEILEETSPQPTPAEVRLGHACQRLRDTERKASDLPLRRERARVEVDRLNGELARAEGAGGDPDSLVKLRQERTQQRELLEDLERAGPIIGRELELAQAEHLYAERECLAEAYNGLVKQQQGLEEVIDEAVVTLVEAIRAKEHLATKQDAIVGSICPYEKLSPGGIRLAYLQYLTDRLQDPIPNDLNWYSLKRIDWSCRRMSDQGSLEEFHG